MALAKKAKGVAWLPAQTSPINAMLDAPPPSAARPRPTGRHILRRKMAPDGRESAVSAVSLRGLVKGYQIATILFGSIKGCIGLLNKHIRVVIAGLANGHTNAHRDP